MKIVKRVKQHGIDFGPERNHFVTQTNPQGHVLGLSENKSDALQMTEAEAAKIVAYHHGREYAGTFTIQDV